MALRVFLEKTVGENCASIDDGEKVLQLIRPELIKGFAVELDFENVKLVLTPFLNTCFGKLLEQFGKELTMTLLIEKKWNLLKVMIEKYSKKYLMKMGW